MNRRRFGSTDLMVSEIGFGGSRIGGLMARGGSGSSVDALHAAFDAGINFYDTADMYSQGEGEQLLGRAFTGRRDRVIIATKGGYLLPTRRRLLSRIKPLVRPLVKMLGIKRQHLPSGASGALTQDFTPAYITQALNASLSRLRTDYIDFYQLHSPPPDFVQSDAFAEIIHTLQTAQRAGKIRHFGVGADSIADAERCLLRTNLACAQVPFGLIDPDRNALIPGWHERGVGVIARGAYGGGFLKDSLSPDELRKLTPKSEWIVALRDIAMERQRSLLELALQFSLRANGVSVTLLGMRTVEHVRENLRYYNSPSLTDDEYVACSELAVQHAHLAGH
jgi:aryl-alcohol dehydrogenase-like predicted oxidoreductase